jgi:phage protein D
MPEALLASAAPVFKIDGRARGELARDLLWLEVDEDTEGLKRLSARFIAAGGDADPAAGRVLYLDGGVLDFGTPLEVSLGPPGTERIVFTGLVSALEVNFEEAATPDVGVWAEDELMRLRMTRRSRTYHDCSDADVARAIAAEHGLAAHVAADGPTYDVVQQFDQSDLALLRERAQKIGAELYARAGTLHFATRPNRAAPPVTLVQGNQLLSVHVRADLAHQRTTVSVAGYDARARARIDERADASAVLSETAGGRSGPQVLARALGAREAACVREVPLTGSEASARARAEMLRRARAFVTVLATTSGTPDLEVGSIITLERVGAPFQGGGYYVTRVRHTYDLVEGHRTHFEAERPTVNAGGG